jgi:hypothetical protein
MSFNSSCLRGDLDAKIIDGNCLIISLGFAKNKKLGGRFKYYQSASLDGLLFNYLEICYCAPFQGIPAFRSYSTGLEHRPVSATIGFKKIRYYN